MRPKAEALGYPIVLRPPALGYPIVLRPTALGYLFNEAFEHVRGLGGGLREGGRGQGVALLLAVLLEEGAGLLHERGLGGVGGEGALLLVEDGADVEGEGPGRGQRLEAVGEEEVGGDVVEALRGVERAERGVALG
jgi:hypothetical protein